MINAPHSAGQTADAPVLQSAADGRTLLLIFVVFVLFALVLLTTARAAQFTVYAPAVMLIGVSLVPLVSASLRRTLDLFEPIQIICLIIGLGFGVRAIYVVSDFRALTTVRLSYLPYADYLPLALQCMIVASACLQVGYFLPIGRILAQRLPRLSMAWPDRVPDSRLLLLYACGMAAVTYRVLQGEVVGRQLASDRVTASTFILWALSQFTLYALGIGAVYAFSNAASKRVWMLCVWLFVPTALLQALMFGGKSPILMAAFAVVGARHYTQKRLSLSALVLAGVIAALLVFPLINIYRGEMYGKFGRRAANTSEFVGNVAELRNYVRRYDVTSYAQFAFENVLARSTGIDCLSLVMKYGSTQDFKTYDYLLIPVYALVPRFLWPEKPSANVSMEFGRRFIISPDTAAESYTSFGMFHTGDLYLNFGWMGLFAGMFVLGTFYRTFYEYLRPWESGQPMRPFAYLFLVWILMNGFETDIPSAFSFFLKVAVFVWIAARIVALPSIRFGSRTVAGRREAFLG